MGVLVRGGALILGAHQAEGLMRRFCLCLIIAAMATPIAAPLSPLAHAQPAQSTTPTVPHAWLFGSWTGGLFPVPSNLTAQACLAQPVVIFTRDLVLRATLIDQVYHQRAIETVRAEPGSTEFRFTPTVDPATAAGSGLFGATAPQPEIGFGCDDPNALHVVRRSENEIIFQGCKDFPEPLVRCPSP